MNCNDRTGARPFTSGARRRIVLLGLGLAVLGAYGCDTDSIVNLPDPDLITTPTVLDPANADAVRNGALFEFARAIAGVANNNETPGLAGVGGYLSDEMVHVSTFGTFRSIDARSVTETNPHVEDVYLWLHRARNLAEQASSLYDQTDRDDAAENQALLMALAGYGYVLFAEHWCANVPYSQAPLGGQLVYRPGIGTYAALDTAISRFDQAISLAQMSGAGDYMNLARVGKARALQNKGELVEAAAVAAQVPEGFVWDVQYSSAASGQTNGLHWHINNELRGSPWTEEGDGGNTVRFFDRGSTDNVIDPRVLVDSAGVGLSTELPHYDQMKYPTRGDDIPLATGTEARLIEAEASLAGGATAGSEAAGNWLAILNDLRADVQGLDPLADPGTPAERVRLLYEERALWLWLTAHRVGDLRRLIREYDFGWTGDDVFPVGTTIHGVTYGDDVALPVPQEERNNPQYDPELCLTSEA